MGATQWIPCAEKPAPSSCPRTHPPHVSTTSCAHGSTTSWRAHARTHSGLRARRMENVVAIFGSIRCAAASHASDGERTAASMRSLFGGTSRLWNAAHKRRPECRAASERSERANACQLPRDKRGSRQTTRASACRRPDRPPFAGSRAAAMETLLGKSRDGYEFVKLLGMGAFAQVRCVGRRSGRARSVTLAAGVPCKGQEHRRTGGRQNDQEIKSRQ